MRSSGTACPAPCTPLRRWPTSQSGDPDGPGRSCPLAGETSHYCPRTSPDTAFTGAAEVTALLGEVTWARGLYQRLLPYRGLHAVIAWGVSCRGAFDRYLGMLAATVGKVDLAREHYESALALEERLRTAPAIARTQYWYGRLLLDSDRGQDRRRARVLLRGARATAEPLGMARLVCDIDELTIASGQLGPSSGQPC